MKKNTPIRKIMTADVETVHTGQKLSDVRKMLSEKPYHHVPVVSGKKLIGIISATDMMRLSFEQYGANQHMTDVILDQQFTIEKVMSEEITSIKDKSTIRDAVTILSEGTFHSLPVVNDDGELEGLVTSTDLLRYLLDQF
ncbi:MAG: CBS domain-containing protein [Deltaproteobacteria bacterium]|nr:CBS domain-containing protein [Deltaproteobacteria bacterium]|tara:strand:- start:20229 stop:20648 length:420 start_codon:yes stop_codon:yes gene_type:complete